MNIGEALEVVCLTDPGRVRSHNEDYVAERANLGLVLLADGMGGYNAGEVASGMATDLIAEGLSEAWHAAPLQEMDRLASERLADRLIREHVQRANAAVYNAARNNAEFVGMGTTLVMGLFYDNRVSVAHIGDSRLYRLRGQVLEQITRDHSLLQEQIEQGLLTREQARLSHNKNLVTRALGIDNSVDAEINTYGVEPGDIYLFCSDGLNDMVDDEEIRLTLLTLKANSKLAAEHLVQAANDSGGRDNISVIVVKVNSSFPLSRSWLVRLKSWFNK